MHKRSTYKGLKRGEKKYRQYLLAIAIISLALSLTGLLNAYFGFSSGSYYGSKNPIIKPSGSIGYLSVFLIVAFAPLPDYLILPIYGYAAYQGAYNIYVLFAVSVVSMLFLMGIEFFGGKYAARTLLLRVLAKVKITEKDLGVADRWISRHGTFSIFIATFIPYLKNVTSLAAGTLKMKNTKFFAANFAGFSIRFSFLLYMGYASMNIIKLSFDTRFRALLLAVALLSIAYITLYTFRLRSDKY